MGVRENAYVSCLCGFLGIDVPPQGYCNNVNEDDDGKVKEEEMAVEKRNGGSDDAVTAQPVASQRPKQLSESKNSKNRR